MTDDPSALKPCPFCGGAAVVKTPPSDYAGTKVICSLCHAKTASFLTPEKAIAAWNQRPTPQGDYAELCERLSEAESRAYAYAGEAKLQGNDWEKRWADALTEAARDNGKALAAIADLQRQLAERDHPTPFFDVAEAIDGLENIALEAFWELNAFDDEEGGYRSLEAIAQSMGRDSEEVRQALDALVALDLADHSDDLKTLEGEDFGEGWARFEDGDRLLNIYEALRYAERQSLKRHQPAERDAVQGDLVEVVARIMFDHGAGWEETWEAAHSRTKLTFRDKAAAVLAAIGPAIRAEERRKVVADIATIMGDFVENWPDHKKASTSIALIAKTLKASREQVLEARATISKLVMCARTSGGTAGPDQGLMEACEDGEMWLAKYESQP